MAESFANVNVGRRRKYNDRERYEREPQKHR